MLQGIIRTCQNEQNYEIFQKNKFLPPDEFFESPIFSLHEFVGPLAFHGLGFFSFRVQDGELEFGAYFALVTADQEEIKAQVVFGLFV